MSGILLSLLELRRFFEIIIPVHGFCTLRSRSARMASLRLSGSLSLLFISSAEQSSYALRISK